MERTYRGARAAAGPLVFVEGARGAIYGEEVRVVPADGAPLRGQVIDASESATVVQILEDTVGLAPARADIVLTGRVTEAVVGTELLGRMLDGRGRPVDGLPEPLGALVPTWGAPMNPVRRRPPSDPVQTGISAIDGLNTLVRGQKLPIFSGAGLPGMELAARVVRDAHLPGGERFAVVFCAVGITERETEVFLEGFASSAARERTVLYLNRARDPTIERLLAPRLALSAAEHLAFEHGLHVLVVLADITHYCEALREIAGAREEIPGRRGYPGTMYSDLASLFERAGQIVGRPGSVTQLPVLTMPDDDITHPIPDLTGYITEGQVVLGRDLDRRGIEPPIDVLPSLSRLMGAGIGEGRTDPDHRAWANQLYALYARGREARMMAGVVGESGLGDADRRALTFADRFEQRLLHQPAPRSVAETLEVGFELLSTVPREDLGRLPDDVWRRRVAPRGTA